MFVCDIGFNVCKIIKDKILFAVTGGAIIKYGKIFSSYYSQRT